MTLTCVHVMLFACNANIYVCSANCQLLCLRVAMLGSLLSNDLNHASTNRWWPGCHGVFSLRPFSC